VRPRRLEGARCRRETRLRQACRDAEVHTSLCRGENLCRLADEKPCGTAVSCCGARHNSGSLINREFLSGVRSREETTMKQEPPNVVGPW